ncbi:hypothetical protein INT44_005046 [Umbelopsis vinacea]|uniref:CHY-type domain-containing protein n=1 Tax=Umbelopsis vinacea TaxID=44442 RepID=A0A8H7Q881_9FUNG|nr:hypothetical protein INT44_005046 [Umbelopsis vinacea]
MQTTQPTRRVVARRPAPRSTQDARAVELAQLQRRFRASYMILEKNEEAMSVRIEITPSDPDFPYELQALSLHIHIPAGYPAVRCSIQVTNPEISRGFARNLEKGFEQHQAAQSAHRTLVQEMAWLDNNMETLLQEPPAPTIRFVSNTVSKTPPPATMAPPAAVEKTSPPAATKHYALEEIQEAKVKREAEIRKLKAQFRNELSDISRDSMTTVLLIKLPLDANCLFKEELGGTINIEMEIPAHYPMDPCRIKIANALNLATWRAQSVEQGFANRSHASPATLFQQLNWLNTNLNALLDVPAPSNPAVIKTQAPPTTQTPPPSAHPIQSSGVEHHLDDSSRKDKKIYVERPLDPVPQAETPSLKVAGDDQDHSSDEASQQESDDDEISIKMASTSVSDTPQQVRSGTEIRFPDLRLENVALLRCARMFLMVKCNRCSNTVEVENIIPDQAAVDSASNGSEKHQRWLPCPTCSSLIGALFKGNYLHSNSITLGLLQLASCTPFDLLPSTYIATCTNCMEPHIPMKLTVHDQPKSTVCRNCHSKMSIGIPNSQFVRIGSGTGSKELRADPAVLQLKKKKQPKQELGLVVGQPLPHQGACEHYRKSRRWFRFSCCNRIYACDRCHDEKEDHKSELAKMHVCGFCSREFASSKSVCACGQEPGKYHAGTFWEGGEGTRNKKIMSRKDKHKYSSSPLKTSSKKQQRVGEAGKLAIKNKSKQEADKST